MVSLTVNGTAHEIRSDRTRRSSTSCATSWGCTAPNTAAASASAAHAP